MVFQHQGNRITFTPKDVVALEKAYAEAVQNSKETFMFMGREWLTNYAKYALQYIKGAE